MAVNFTFMSVLKVLSWIMKKRKKLRREREREKGYFRRIPARLKDHEAWSHQVILSSTVNTYFFWVVNENHSEEAECYGGFNQINFISNAPNPVSVKQLTNKDFNIDLLLKEIQKEIIERYIQCTKEGIDNIRKEYHNYLYRNNGYYHYKDQTETFLAKIDCVEETGHLVLIDLHGNKRRYGFKEVTFLF